MAIDVGRLEDELMQMSAEGAPGREFCEAISELAVTGRFAQLRDVLPGIVYDELWCRYQEDPVAFVAGWRMLAQEMRQGFVQHARQRLTSLTRLQQEGSGAETPAWQEIQRALDGQQNDLLRAAIALELLELVEPAVLRATHCASALWRQPAQRTRTGTWMRLRAATSSACLQHAPSCAGQCLRKQSNRSCPWVCPAGADALPQYSDAGQPVA